MFIYIPVRGLLLSRRIVVKTMEERGVITVRVSRVSHTLRFNEAADRAIRRALGQHVRATVGELRTILQLETTEK